MKIKFYDLNYVNQPYSKLINIYTFPFALLFC